VSWIEGFPTEPGDYWFYRTYPGAPSLSKVAQGYSAMSGNGVLIHIAGDFLYPGDFGTPLYRIWHMPLTLPDAPDFDRTCPTCKGTGERSFDQKCFDCNGTGKL